MTIMPRLTADAAAPPTPCRKRAPTSVASLHATPHSSEASVNSGESGEQHAPAADEVAEPAGEQQQPAEGDEVGVDDPGEAGLR